TPNLENCDQEPIHIIGNIQSIGYLLVLERKGLEIVQASENIIELLEVPAHELVGNCIEYYFPYSFLEYVNNLAKNEHLDDLHSLSFELRKSPYLLTVHQSDGYWVLEIEKDDPKQRDHSFFHYSDLVENILSEIREYDSIEEMSQKVIAKVKEITRFNRLMVYRFDEEGHGEVIAEEKEEDLPPYLGLKFPNTDIPAQARKLYLKSRTRGIYDVDDTSSAIYPPVRKQDGKPLDMTNSFLRSVSPMHIQYLKNMGVKASFSISIVLKDKLWGMILCHHTEAPVRLNLYQRRACQFIGRMFSHRVEAKLFDQQFKGFRDRLKTAQTLVNTLMATSDLHHTLDMNTPRLLSAFHADYYALQFEGQLSTSHPSLRKDWVSNLIREISVRGGGIQHTTNIFEDFKLSSHEAVDPAGMLSIQLSKEMDEYLILFRKPQHQKIEWAGKPIDKASSDGTQSLAPRHSFEAWTEVIRNRAFKWEPDELQFGKELRMQLIQNIITVFQGKERSTTSTSHIQLNSRLLERIAELEEKNRTLSDNLKGLEKSEAEGRIAKDIAEERNRIKPV
ncbi:MAG TPA: hypothetical protein DIU20_00805, partial [Cryomorphaceae bacterium]|nr:hypothetical protein [Cryomorphaceae bacterium]